MSWVRLDDQFPDHPKVAGLSNEAFCLHVTAMCWTAKQQTYGKLPYRLLSRLAWRCQDPATASAELEAAGVWDKTPEGWEIHDFLVYNPTKEQTAELAAKRSEAGKAGADARWHGDSKSDGKSDGKQDNKNLPPSPSPSPSPSPTQSPSQVPSPDPTEASPTPLAAGDKPATNGKSARFVDPSVFLSQIGYKNPESLLREADETLLAKWIFYYQCLTPDQRRAIQSWPALINDRIHSNTPPRLTGDQSARFYQEWGNHDD